MSLFPSGQFGPITIKSAFPYDFGVGLDEETNDPVVRSASEILGLAGNGRNSISVLEVNLKTGECIHPPGWQFATGDVIINPNRTATQPVISVQDIETQFGKSNIWHLGFLTNWEAPNPTMQYISAAGYWLISSTKFLPNAPLSVNGTAPYFRITPPDSFACVNPSSADPPGLAYWGDYWGMVGFRDPTKNLAPQLSGKWETINVFSSSLVGSTQCEKQGFALAIPFHVGASVW